MLGAAAAVTFESRGPTKFLNLHSHVPPKTNARAMRISQPWEFPRGPTNAQGHETNLPPENENFGDGGKNITADS